MNRLHNIFSPFATYFGFMFLGLFLNASASAFEEKTTILSLTSNIAGLASILVGCFLAFHSALKAKSETKLNEITASEKQHVLDLRRLEIHSLSLKNREKDIELSEREHALEEKKKK